MHTCDSGVFFLAGQISELGCQHVASQASIYIQEGVCLFGCGPSCNQILIESFQSILDISNQILIWIIQSILDIYPETICMKSFMFLSCTFKLIHISFRGWGQILENQSKFSNFCSVHQKIVIVEGDLWIPQPKCPQSLNVPANGVVQNEPAKNKWLHFLLLSAVGFEPTPPYEDQNLSLAP